MTKGPFPDDGWRREIGRVESTLLGWEDHGILTAQVTLNYGGSAQSAGGHALDTPLWRLKDDQDGTLPVYTSDVSVVDKARDEWSHSVRCGTAYGMEFVMRILRACRADRWEGLPGKTVVALFDEAGGYVRGLEPLPIDAGGFPDRYRFVFADLRADIEAIRTSGVEL